LSADYLTIVTWFWGDKYDVSYVHKLAASLKRNVTQPYRFFVMTERERKADFGPGVERHAIKDPELLKEKGCFARLRMWEEGWQDNRRCLGRIACVDLDNVITANCDHLFYKPAEFTILQGVNSKNPCPYNGSIMMLRAHTNSHAWYDFSLKEAYRLPYDSFPDDQGWLAVKIPNAAAYGMADGVYAYQKPGWPAGDKLPDNACMVAFPGWRDPKQFQHLHWVKEHWRI
jgi:hypothetical protein